MRFNDFLALGTLDDRIGDIKAQARLGFLLAAATVTLEALLLEDRQDLLLKIDPFLPAALYCRQLQTAENEKKKWPATCAMLKSPGCRG